MTGDERFIGFWRLTSFEFRSLATGSGTYPLGENAIGLLTYSPAKMMSVQVMRVDRPSFAANDQRLGTELEVQAAFNGYVAYYGSYEVFPERGVVRHHLEASLYPNWVGDVQERIFEFTSENELTLKTQPIQVQGTPMEGRLSWRRI